MLARSTVHVINLLFASTTFSKSTSAGWSGAPWRRLLWLTTAGGSSGLTGRTREARRWPGCRLQRRCSRATSSRSIADRPAVTPSLQRANKSSRYVNQHSNKITRNYAVRGTAEEHAPGIVQCMTFPGTYFRRTFPRPDNFPPSPSRTFPRLLKQKYESWH